MSKPRAPKVNTEAVHGNKGTIIDALGARFRQHEAQREAGQMVTPYIALEALGALVGGRVAGHSDAELRKAWPEAWGEESVTAPIALLAALQQGWLAYMNAPDGMTLGEAFRIEGHGQGRQRLRDMQKGKDRRRGLANEVEIEYLSAGARGKPIPLCNAIEIVAERQGISAETVKAAHREFRDEIRAGLRSIGTLSDEG